MSVELSVPSGNVGLEAAADGISSALAELLGQHEPVQLRIEVRDLDEQWIGVVSHPSQVQVLRFDVPASPAGPSESHLNVTVADRTPLGIAVMLATAIVLAERDEQMVVDDSALFGATEHHPSELRRRAGVRADGEAPERAAQSLCRRFGLAATASSATPDARGSSTTT